MCLVYNNKNICKLIIICCIMSFLFVTTFYNTSFASAKHFILGGLVGAGAVIAWPTIVGGVSTLASGMLSLGAAVSGAVATGGAAVGGAIAGIGSAVGSAVTAGFGAVGSAVAAITASPLFVPALIIAGVAIAGYFVYKHFKDKEIKNNISPFNNTNTTVSKNSGRIVEPPEVSDKNTKPTNNDPVIPDKNKSISDKNMKMSSSNENNPSFNDVSAKAIKDKYQAAYQNYVRLLATDTSNGTSPELQQAFYQLKLAQEEYKNFIEKNSVSLNNN